MTGLRMNGRHVDTLRQFIMAVCVCIYTYMYIYIEREREREGGRDKEREREKERYGCIYIYYIHTYISTYMYTWLTSESVLQVKRLKLNFIRKTSNPKS